MFKAVASAWFDTKFFQATLTSPPLCSTENLSDPVSWYDYSETFGRHVMNKNREKPPF